MYGSSGASMRCWVLGRTPGSDVWVTSGVTRAVLIRIPEGNFGLMWILERITPMILDFALPTSAARSPAGTLADPTVRGRRLNVRDIRGLSPTAPEVTI